MRRERRRSTSASEAPPPIGRRPDILYVTHRVPYPPDKGDRIRNYHLIRHLAPLASVHLATLADEPIPDGAIDHLGRLCERVEVVPLGPWGRRVRAAASLLGGGTATEGAFASARLASTLRRWSREVKFHSALASASSVAPYLRLPGLRGVPAVVDLVDVDSEKWLDYAGEGRSPRALLFRTEGHRLRRLERTIPRWARAVTLVSEAEADLYRGLDPEGTGTVRAVTNGVDLEYFRPRTEPIGSADCVFVGALDYRPNIDGILWFCREVWPDVHRRCPDARLRLVGRNPSHDVARMATLPGVEVIGSVPDVRPHLARAAVVIAPLQIARGVQNKILEALAMGKAVVASPQAIDGLRVDPGVHLLEASSPARWCEEVVRLLADEGMRRSLGVAGRRYVEDCHRWERCLGPFAALLGLDEGPASSRPGRDRPDGRPRGERANRPGFTSERSDREHDV